MVAGYWSKVWWLAAAALAVGCGSRSLALRPASDVATPDSGGEPSLATADGATSAPGLRSTLVVQTVGMVDALAMDLDGVYWTTTDNTLWALDTGSTTPRQLAQDLGRYPYCTPSHRLATGGRQVFWIARQDTAGDKLTIVLHRTAKTGGRDEIIADHLRYAEPPDVVADDARVYWTEGTGDGTGENLPGGVIRALPIDAVAGVSPPTIVASVGPLNQIFTMALDGGALYYDSSQVVGTTIYSPGIVRVDVAAAPAGQAWQAPQAGVRGWLPSPHQGDLYYLFNRDLWHTSVMRVPGDGGAQIELMPVERGADGILVLDDWALVSLASSSCGDRHHQLVAVTTLMPGGGIVHLVDDAATAAVLGQSLAYVDFAGQLHLSTPDQVRAAIASAPRD